MADDDSSELSSLSSLSPAPSDDEMELQLKPEKGILKFFHKVPKNAPAQPREPSPPPRKRSPSPPHEDVLADNQDIAFIVMFRNRLNDAFPKNLANFGPQELESDIVGSVPGERAESFLCALLKLLLNRQQDVKPGHYNRALEEAVTTHKNQWVRGWTESPLAGGKSFTSMNPTERLTLLRALVLWAMSSSKVVRDIIDHAYKGKRQEDDSNIKLSVQPVGTDSDKRRYYLVEGHDDTSFRVYRESNPVALYNRTWWSVAGSIEELQVLTNKLETSDRGPKAKRLAGKLNDEIPRFEAGEEKRKRREYRQMRRDAFKRPEPGFSMYEGRTRGKRMKYTYSDDEDFLTDSTGYRRSARNTRGHTPAEPSGPVTTASGRQIRAPSRLNAETTSNGGVSAAPSIHGDHDGDIEMADGEEDVGPTGRPRRSAAVNHGTNGWTSKKSPKEDEYDSEEEDESEPDFGDDEEEEHVPEDEEEDEEEFEQPDLDDNDDEVEDAPISAVVKMPMKVKFDKETGKWTKMPKETPNYRESSSEPSDKSHSDGQESPQSNDSSAAHSPVQTVEEIAVATKRVFTNPLPKAKETTPPPTASSAPKKAALPTGKSIPEQKPMAEATTAPMAEPAQEMKPVSADDAAFAAPLPTPAPTAPVSTAPISTMPMSTAPASTAPPSTLGETASQVTNPATSLAFRGSPEKPQSLPQPATAPVKLSLGD